MPHTTNTSHDMSSSQSLSEPQHSEAFLSRAMTDWGPAVYRLALAHTRSQADAEDVYQDVFLSLFNSSTMFESSEHLKAWLLRVTINRCHDLAKSSWKRRTVELDPEWDTPAVHLQDEEDATIWDVVGKLPEQQRTAIHLHYVEGYSTEEIAQLAGCQPATARTWLHRGRLRVKELLEAENESEATVQGGNSQPSEPSLRQMHEHSPPPTCPAPLFDHMPLEPIPKGGIL